MSGAKSGGMNCFHQAPAATWRSCSSMGVLPVSDPSVRHDAQRETTDGLRRSGLGTNGIEPATRTLALEQARDCTKTSYAMELAPLRTNYDCFIRLLRIFVLNDVG